MLFLRPPTNADDIRQFARRFNEGIRVEYKSTFDVNVRRNTAKMISSFANSLGGVAVIGVNAVNGVPQDPIEGFDLPTEELPLVVEQICLQGIDPPVIPKIHQVLSDVPGKGFLVIEIDESPEAPHAIENHKRVYVRTGNAANPYDLAEVDIIIERFTRRQESERRREALIARQEARSESFLTDNANARFQVGVGPTYPHRPLLSREDVWQFASTERYRGGRFIPGPAIRRTNDGVSGAADPGNLYVDLDQHGLVFWKALVRMTELMPGEAGTLYLNFSDVFHPTMKALLCSSRFCRSTRYRGPIRAELRMHRCQGRSMPFLPEGIGGTDLDDYRSVEGAVYSDVLTETETLETEQGIVSVLQQAISQFCWSFWQPEAPFPQEQLDAYVANRARDMGFR